MARLVSPIVTPLMSTMADTLSGGWNTTSAMNMIGQISEVAALIEEGRGDWHVPLPSAFCTEQVWVAHHLASDLRSHGSKHFMVEEQWPADSTSGLSTRTRCCLGSLMSWLKKVGEGDQLERGPDASPAACSDGHDRGRRCPPGMPIDQPFRVGRLPILCGVTAEGGVELVKLRGLDVPVIVSANQTSGSTLEIRGLHLNEADLIAQTHDQSMRLLSNSSLSRDMEEIEALSVQCPPSRFARVRSGDSCGEWLVDICSMCNCQSSVHERQFLHQYW